MEEETGEKGGEKDGREKEEKGREKAERVESCCQVILTVLSCSIPILE